MTTNTQQLKQKILSRVYIIYAARRVLSPFMIKIYIALGLFWQLLAHISFLSIIKNAPGLEIGTVPFFAEAFLKTETGIKFLLVIGVLLTTWLFIDIIIKALPILGFGKVSFRLGEKIRA